MSDTTLAFAIIPFLIALTLVLECTRIGCQWLDGRVRRRGRRARRQPDDTVPGGTGNAISPL